MRCAKCGAENSINAKFCRGCGVKLEPVQMVSESMAHKANVPSVKICSECGGKNAEGAVFCRECGASFGKKNQGTIKAEEPSNAGQFAKISYSAAGKGINSDGVIKNIITNKGDLLKKTFTTPKDVVVAAKENASYSRSTAVLTAIFGLVISLINALDYDSNKVGFLKLSNGLQNGMDTIPISALGVFVFTFAVVCLITAACIGIAFGIMKLFHTDCRFENVAGAMFPAIFVMMAGIMLGELLFATETLIMIECAVFIVIVFFAWSVTIWKSVFEEFIPASQIKQMYSFVISIAAIMIVVYVTMLLFKTKVLLSWDGDLATALVKAGLGAMSDGLHGLFGR